ncbi:MAG: glycogen synthase [Clostridia bacterium]|nr:glycogen synthase [Clostridia bacterium]
MKIVFAASEAAPFIKTGGLGDVAQALPLALSRFPHTEVLLFLPYYGKIKEDPSIKTERIAAFDMSLSWRTEYVGLYRLVSRKRKERVFFIDNEAYFKRDQIYGEPDDGERFAFFSKAILESLTRLREKPDVIHCNDWQTALIPVLLHAFYQEELGDAKTVFTIHNIEYQGWVHPYFLGDVLGLSDKYNNSFQLGDGHNFMKNAILNCDALTTVSRTYARQICDPAFGSGLDRVISDHAFKLSGIVNGIDPLENDPARDPYLAASYSARDFEAGKAADKAALQKELALPVRRDVPVIGMVSRLVSHKGFDLFCDALGELMNWDVQFVILGTGEAGFENALRQAASVRPDRVSAQIRFSKELASRVYAGCDLFLMPSRSEPCGLSQLIAMRYGTIPVVHETGGLKDTVLPFRADTGEGYGFTFRDFSREGLLDALRRALTLFGTDKALWKRAVKNCMTADLSWKEPANEYLSLYERLIHNSL